MFVDVVTPSLAKNASGLRKSVPTLYAALSERYDDFQYRYLTLQAADGKYNYAIWPPAQFGFSPGLLQQGLNTKADIIHTHGIWMATSLYSLVAQRKRPVPAVISPRSMLNPWILARNKLQKFIARFLYEKRAWLKASRFIALCGFEADAIKAVVPTAQIAVVPNAISIPNNIRFNRSNHNRIFNLLFLGRFHDQKNVLALIKAAGHIRPEVYNRRPFCLQLVGWGNERYVKRVKHLIAAQPYPARFSFIGPAFGTDKERIFRNAQAFILPSVSEGIPNAVLEAWSYGLPVLKTEACNLVDAFTLGAAFEISTTVDSLRVELEDFLSLSNAELDTLAQNGYAYVQKRHSWDVVAPLMFDVYRELL